MLKIGDYVKYSENYYDEFLKYEFNRELEDSERTRILRVTSLCPIEARFIIPTKGGRIKGLGATHIMLEEEDFIKTTLKASMDEYVNMLKRDEYYIW